MTPRPIQLLATLAACCLVVSQAIADGGRLEAGLDEGAGVLRARLPQVGELGATWSATIDDGTRLWRLDSAATHEHFSPEMRSAGGRSTARMSFPGARAEVLLEIRIDAGMALCARVGVRNSGGRPFKFVSAHPVQARIMAAGSGWALTGLHPRTAVTAEQPGAAPLLIHEHGMFYRPDGTGFVFGPSGEPVSYADFSWSRPDNGVVTMNAVVSMDGVRVDPGETRWAQEIALGAGNRAGLWQAARCPRPLGGVRRAFPRCPQAVRRAPRLEQLEPACQKRYQYRAD